MQNVIIIAFFAVLLFVLLIILAITSKKRKELQERALNKRREEALERVLRNQDHQENEKNRKVSNVPYAVDYSKSISPRQGKTQTEPGKLMIQLIAHSELSVQRYMLNPADGIVIGREKGQNSIVVTDPTVAKRQCEIFFADGAVYLRDISSSSRTMIRRKKNTTYANSQGIKLLTGDRIYIGNMIFDITLFG